jgi:hypothetical protein
MKLLKALLINTLLFISLVGFSQDQKPESRFIKFNDEQNIFVGKNGQIEVRDIQLCNIAEDESSKPMHIAVNELSNVIKFNIKSHSEQFTGERSFYVILNSTDYLETFRMVLYTMQVEYVWYNKHYISIDEFYLQLKNK